MQRYSKAFRRDVLAACAGGGTREVALLFDFSESWIRRIKQERRELGKVAPSNNRNRRKTWETHAEWILAKLDAQPDIYLRELQAAAREELGWTVSDVTLSHASTALKRTRKKDTRCGRARAGGCRRSQTPVVQRTTKHRSRSSCVSRRNVGQDQ